MGFAVPALVLTLGLVSEARAGSAPASERLPLPALQVERPLVLPRGWVQLSLSQRHHRARGEPFEDVAWARRTDRLSLAWGVTRRVEVWGELSLEHGRLEAEGRVLRGRRLGDPRLGARLELLHQEPPARSAMVEAWVRSPVGPPPRGARAGPVEEIDTLWFTTGTPDLYMGAAYRQQVGPFALTGRGGYLGRLPRPVPYEVTLGDEPLRGWLAPGDQVWLRGEALLQAGPVVAIAGPRAAWHLPSRMGPGRERAILSGTGGPTLDVVLGLGLNVSRGLDLGASLSLPLVGRGPPILPLDRLQPTPGPTWSTTLELRR